ncbi:hypothetical protein T484DRAFT_1830390 [Baffinella frigidus]|nr:hypothetical protein T484DRAFT_1830390 [Cryptophyta sp. CCMP2293]
MAPILPYDFRPSKRTKALQAKRSASRSQIEGLITGGLGPLLLHLPVQTLHVQHLANRWARVSVANRADAVLQMRAAAALLLLHPNDSLAAGNSDYGPSASGRGDGPASGAGNGSKGSDSAWREEWALLCEMAAHLACSHAALLPREAQAALQTRLDALRDATSSGEAVTSGGEEAFFAGCRDARAAAILSKLVAPALALVGRWITGGKRRGGEEEVEACGQAWGLVGAARLHLLVGEHAVDPAAKFAVKLAQHAVDPAAKFAVKLAQVEAEERAAANALAVRRLQAALHPGGWGKPEETRLVREIARLRKRAAALRLKARLVREIARLRKRAAALRLKVLSRPKHYFV